MEYRETVGLGRASRFQPVPGNGQTSTELIPDCLIIALFVRTSRQIDSTAPLVMYLMILNIPLRKFGPLPKPKFPMLWFLLVLRNCRNSCHHLVTHLMIPSYTHLTFYLLHSWVLFSGSLMYSNYMCSRSKTVGKQS